MHHHVESPIHRRHIVLIRHKTDIQTQSVGHGLEFGPGLLGSCGINGATNHEKADTGHRPHQRCRLQKRIVPFPQSIGGNQPHPYRR